MVYELGACLHGEAINRSSISGVLESDLGTDFFFKNMRFLLWLAAD